MLLSIHQKLITKCGRMDMLAVMLATVIVGCGIGFSYASLPAGLDGRTIIAAYLDGALPTTTSGSLPLLLSQTGAYSNLSTRTPHAGLIPYAGNSALWTDGSLKSRYIGLPYDGTASAPKIGFTTTGAWTFPNGTVFVKNFDLVVDERVGAANPIRRLETRILVRLSTGGIRGATYKWRPDNSDADIVPNALNETVTITQANNTTRTQTWAYPSPSQCLICHNTDAGMVLGVKTAQLNGNYTYPAPGRSDNQLHTFHHLGMFDQAIADPPSSYARMVDVLDASATMEDRVKSYQDANCSHCHRPDGSRPFSARGPLFDMRYDTPILAPVGAGRIPIVANSGFDGLVRRNIPNSSIHERDSIVGFQQMPPLARNVPDQRILALYDQWVNYAYDVMSVTRLTRNSVRLKFNRAVDSVTVNALTNYAFTGGVTVSQAVQGTDPSEVVLTTSTLAANTSYTVTVNRVKEAQAPQNPIWPNTQFQFTTPPTTVPGAPTINVGAAGNGQISMAFTAPDSDGGSPITGYVASCTPGSNTATGAGSPLTVTALNNGTQYTCNVRAINAIGTGNASSGIMLTPNAVVPDPPTGVSATRGNASATITFTAPAGNGGAAITNYTAISAPSGITGSCVAPCTSIGVMGLTNGTAYTFTVTATNAIGTGAPSAMSNSVTPATLPGAPTIGAASAGNASATVTFSAPGSNGGSAITGYTATSNPSGVTGTCANSPCTVTGLANGTAYTFTVTAANAVGSGGASTASNSVTPKAPQTITFANPGTQIFGSSPTLTASASSGLAVSFSSSTTGVCTITTSGTLTFVTTGTCTINADQAGDGFYTAAQTVTQSFSVNAGSQTIAFGAAPTIVFGGAGMVTATGGGSNNPIVFTSTTTGVCTIAGNVVSGVTAGVCTIAANQAGNANYTAAPQVTLSFSIGAASQTITFGTAPTVVVGGTGMVSATGGGSNNPIVFTSTTTSVCTITGNVVTGVSVGVCTIAANQTGNANYAAAPQATQSFNVDPPPIAFTGDAYSRKTHGNGIGVQDLPLLNATINGTFTVEPRMAGSGHQVVFRFTNTVTSVTGVSITDASATVVGNPSVGFSGNDLILTLSGIGDMTRVTVSVTGVNGFVGLNASRAVGFLVGDMNGSRVVTAADIAGLKSRKGISIDSSNFQFDINLSGAIDDADVSMAKARSAQVLP